jgi:type VI secretion system VgrG family protein
MRKHRDITISKLEDLHIDYFVCDLEIKEKISEATDITAKVLIFHRDIWRVRIDLHTEVRIRIISRPRIGGIVERFFCGHIIALSKKFYEAEESPINDDRYILELHIKHKLYNLALNNNYLIHKEKTTHIILKELCDRYTVVFLSHAMHLEGLNQMLIQYGENDLHFFERLLQYYGCYYICREDAPEVRVFDSLMGYEEIEKKISVHRISRKNNFEMGTIVTINEYRQLKPRRYASHNYNRKIPMKLEGFHDEMLRDEYGLIDIYPTSANTLIESEKNAHNLSKQFVDLVYEGTSYCFDFKIGKRIIIEEIDILPRVITSVTHRFTIDNPKFNNNTTKYTYYNTFTLIDATHTFTSNKLLKKPLVTGLQTAKVTCLDRVNEIEVNEKGEIFIIFAWGRELESRSCWVPVAQSMAGRFFGSFIIPRVGDEVLVHFINGDPDRPIVYGGIHTDEKPGFNDLPEDKFKTVLMKSHTFLSTDPEKCNEISMTDIRCQEKLFLKAHKDLDIVVGSDERDLENNLNTRIRGKGHKYSHIEDGDSILEMKSGRFFEKVRGDYETHICRGDKGGDYIIRIEDGKLIIDVGGDGLHKYGKILDIQVIGDCRIKAEGAMDLGSILKMTIHSDDEIIMRAPRITLDAEDKISGKAGNDITYEAGRQVKVTAGEDIIGEASGKVSLKAAGDILEEAGGALRQKAVGVISSLCDTVEIKAATECAIEGGMKIGINGGMEVAIHSGMETVMDSAVRTSIKSGMDITLDAGVNMRMVSGVHVVVEAGIDVGVRAGIEANFGAGVNGKLSGDVMLDIIAGIDMSKMAGIAMEQEIGIDCEMTVGLFYETYVGLFATIRTCFEVFVRRPAF